MGVCWGGRVLTHPHPCLRLASLLLSLREALSDTLARKMPQEIKFVMNYSVWG